eukprot:CAMPEP_0172553540 /NCGR_PEP_ID=MMETSP1067-20121228/51265_1 /TAXON_ID=265564 ORGANISM="Thalassiosira punctigera, Strain Tpunct2005C2" /NCGR_SAMPLE_ID=MMETSP1067 /ASSEMBLY_ACC=CAM_ASM_000444 /LENGTH=278 /DNA_ID=CAMNT_0013341747 /DNA_START=237 /DNA_END=1073 /DNA_ORIENTATION=+
MAQPMQQHYAQHSATSYDSAFFYSAGDYLDHITALVHDKFLWSKEGSAADPTPVTLLDIGGGTGSFTKRLVEQFPTNTAIVIDPFLEPAKNADAKNLFFFEAAADDFLKPMKQHDSAATLHWRSGYHQVLMKEVVHHLPEQQRTAIFRGICEGFARHPKHKGAPALLIITRPQKDIDYPLWTAARKVWAENQPAHQDIMQELQDAGFSRLVCSTHGYECRMALKRWKAMVQGRCWSTFSSFTDAELQEACDAMDEQYALDENGHFGFEDRLVFISAYL